MVMDEQLISLSDSRPRPLNVTANQLMIEVDLLETLFLELKLQSRASIVIVLSFSVATSAAVIISILYDSFQRAKRRQDPQEKRLYFLLWVPAVNVLPLAVAISFLFRGAVLLWIQSLGVQYPLFRNCRTISQITWTACWVSEYVLLTLGAENAYKILKPHHFTRLNDYFLLSLRYSIISVMTISTWIPSRLRLKDADICLAYMPHLINTWSDIATVLTATLILLYIVIAATLNIRLRRTSVVCHSHEQVAKESMFFLIVNTILFALTLPFWVQSSYFESSSGKIEMMASLAISLFGLVNAILYVVLRATLDERQHYSKKPACLSGLYRRGHDSTELALAHQITKPVDLEQNNSARQTLVIPAKEQGDQDNPQSRPSVPASTQMSENQILATNERIPGRGKRCPFDTLERHFSFPRQHRDRSQYSIFPVRLSSQRPREIIHDSPTDDQDKTLLLPPRPAFAKHRRYSSELSAATVQIGLRLSNVAMPASMQQGMNASTQSLTLASPTHQSRTSARSTGLNNNTRRGALNSPQSLTPPPLTISKRDRAASPLRSVQRTGDSGHQRTTGGVDSSGKRSWPLPERLSLLPKKTYRQESWI